MSCILITGSSGLVGRELRHTLELRGHDVRGVDVRASELERGDVRDPARMTSALDGVVGVIHLAAISRVVWGERDPETCWSINVDGLRNVLDCVQRRTAPPWVIFASSREVYGHPDSLPVAEDAPCRPVNVYGRSKVAGENLIEAARRGGARTAVVRLSNVYGSTLDHVDRVVPAFARAAVLGDVLRVEGSSNEFDFTHVTDAARGIAALVERLSEGADAASPIQFVSGESTTLGALARRIISLGNTASVVEEAPPRSFDVSRFRGSGARAKAILDWSPRVSLEDGLARLVEEFRRCKLNNAGQHGGVL